MNSFILSLYTTRIFLGISISTLPIVISSIFEFKAGILFILLFSLLPILILDFIFNKDQFQSGYSLFVGLFIYFMMPFDIPFYIPTVASIFASLISVSFKRHGMPFNIVAISLCFVYFLFPNYFSISLENSDKNNETFLYKLVLSDETTQIYSSNLGIYLTNSLNNLLKHISLNIPSGYVDLFLFKKSNIINEGNILVILFSFTLFYFIGYIRWYSVLFYFLGFSVPVYIWGSSSLFNGDILIQIFSGSFLFGMFFIYNDINTSPISNLGMIICSFFSGFLVFIFRKYSVFLDGVPFAIAFVDIIRPIIDNIIFKIKLMISY